MLFSFFIFIVKVSDVQFIRFLLEIADGSVYLHVFFFFRGSRWLSQLSFVGDVGLCIFQVHVVYACFFFQGTRLPYRYFVLKMSVFVFHVHFVCFLILQMAKSLCSCVEDARCFFFFIFMLFISLLILEAPDGYFWLKLPEAFFRLHFGLFFFSKVQMANYYVLKMPGDIFLLYVVLPFLAILSDGQNIYVLLKTHDDFLLACCFSFLSRLQMAKC